MLDARCSMLDARCSFLNYVSNVFFSRYGNRETQIAHRTAKKRPGAKIKILVHLNFQMELATSRSIRALQILLNVNKLQNHMSTICQTSGDFPPSFIGLFLANYWFRILRRINLILYQYTFHLGFISLIREVTLL
jgi:hypothetical protein